MERSHSTICLLKPDSTLSSHELLSWIRQPTFCRRCLQAAEKLKFSKNKIKFHDPSVYQKYLSRFSNGYDNTYAPSAAEAEQSARDASKSTVFALAMVGAPLVLIGALIASRGLI